MSKSKSAPPGEQEKKQAELSAKPDGFLVVGIGASAGGVQALREFFEHVPGDSGMAYVVILHLSPDHDSQLAAVLQQVAMIPVTQVTERVRVAPNHVYVIPPDQHLIMEDGHIAVIKNARVEDRRAPVDIFFRTLADSHHARSVGVILSGTGANGSMGIKRIKERGGAAFVQNPREAEYNEMPRNAIATELIDEILPVREIPATILAYKESLGKVGIPEEPEHTPEDQQQALREIFTMLRVRTGHDFFNYKRPTLLRRIERRINVRNLPNLPAYAAYMHEHPEESVALLKDLLISVTNFFRDKKAFEFIQTHVLPALLAKKKPANPCASGASAAPPARKPTALPCSAPSRQPAFTTHPRFRFSRPILMKKPSPPRAKDIIRSMMPPTYRPNGCAAFSTRMAMATASAASCASACSLPIKTY